MLARLDCGAPDVAIEAQHDELTNCSLFAATRRDVGGALEPDGLLPIIHLYQLSCRPVLVRYFH